MAHTDHAVFQFVVNENDITLEDALYSSQKGSFTSTSDGTKNVIDVVASKLRFTSQPASVIEAGLAMSNAVSVEALDTYNAKDLDFTGTVNLEATANNLIASPRSVAAVDGTASFDTLRFFAAHPSDTLIASSGSLYPVKSNPFEVRLSSLSDIIPDVNF